MSTFHARVQRLLSNKQDQVRRRHPELNREVATPQHAAATRNGTAVVLGRDSGGAPLSLNELTRREHMHVIGTTGAGKSNLIVHMAKQDILNGRGTLVVDPHGNHPDSPYRQLLTWLDDTGLARNRIVHLIDPNISAYTTGFNPLAVPEGHDPAVIAEAGLEAFQRLWADEDPDSKPTIQRLLPAVLTALAERGLTLAEALAVLDPDDRNGIRELLLSEVQDEYARDELQWLQDMGADRTGRRDLRMEVMGPRNRIAKLLRASAVRCSVGQTERTLDLRRVMDEGHIVLANLSGGTQVYEQGADLLGRLLVRFLVFHAKRRCRTDVSFGVYLDECQRYLSGDVPVVLAELRKQGVMMLLAHQWSSQLSNVDEEILSAVRNATNIKAVFRVKDPSEAAELAEMVIPLNLETPVDALTKETVIGYELRHMRNASSGSNVTHTRSDAETHTRGTGVTRTEGESYTRSLTTTESEQEAIAHTVGSSRSVAVGKTSSRGSTTNHSDTESYSEAEGLTQGHATSSSHGGGRSQQDSQSSGSNFSQSFEVPVNAWRSGEGSYGRAAAFGIATGRNVTAGYNSGQAHNSGSSESWADGESNSEARSSQSGRTSGHTDGYSDSESEGNSYVVTDTDSESTTHGTTSGFSIARGQSWGESKSIAHSHQESIDQTVGRSIGIGQTSSAGWSETMVPIMGMRPNSVHSKENILYRAAQAIRSLPTGTCFINWVDHGGMQNALLRVPRLATLAISEQEFAKLRNAVFERSPSALSRAEAEHHLAERRQRLIASTHRRTLLEEPTDFRVARPNSARKNGDSHD